MHQPLKPLEASKFSQFAKMYERSTCTYYTFQAFSSILGQQVLHPLKHQRAPNLHTFKPFEEDQHWNIIHLKYLTHFYTQFFFVLAYLNKKIYPK